MTGGGWATGNWLITGASSGIGLALAEAVARAGGRAIAATRRPETLAAVAAALPGHLLPLNFDAGDPAAAAEAVRAAGDIDVLVNNAGYGLLGAVEETDEAELRAQLEVNFFAPAAIIRAVLPAMRARRRGVIINITSVSGLIGQPGSAYYAASKFAMEGFSEALRKEAGPLGIRAMTVEPGAVRTDFFSRSRRFAAQRIPDYALVEQRRATEPGAVDQPGDPARCAAAILAAIDTDPLPEQLVLGAAAAALVETTLEARLGEVRRLTPLSQSADYPEQAP